LKTRILALSILISFGASIAHAEPPPPPVDYARPGWYVSAFGVYALNHYRDTQNPDYEGSPGMNIRGGYRGSEWYAIEAEIEWIYRFEDKDDDDIYNRVFIGGVNAKFYPFHERVQPYLVVGVNGMNVHAKNPPPKGDFGGTDWGFRFGLGADFYITEHIAVSLESSYVLGVGDIWKADYSSHGLGLTYRF
jgi:opacity protein-like surface antigen